MCLLPAEPPDADGKAPEPQRAGVKITVSYTNISSNDPEWGVKYEASADAEGRYKLALNPGEYSVFVYDPTRLKGMAI